MKRSWQTATRVFAPLHRRIGFFSLIIFMMFSLAIFVSVEKLHADTALESTQKMNFGLARYLVDHRMSPLLNTQGEVDDKALKGLATDVMMTNPALEVYLLGADGQIKAHAIDGFHPLLDKVNLEPINRLLSIESSNSIKLPLYGDDPRHPTRKNIFSVAAIDPSQANGQPQAYLYVILQGQAARSIDQVTNRSNALYQTLWLLGCSIAVALLLLWMSYSFLTRPLRLLAEQISSFQKKAMGTPSRFVNSLDEVASLDREIKSMRSRISQSLAEIEQSHSAKRDLVSNISHDLFTPLACIQSYTERCLTIGDPEHGATNPPGELENNLKVILRQSKRMGERLNALFEFSRLDSDSVVPKLEVTDLSELLHDVVRPYQLEARANHIDLTIHVVDGQIGQSHGTPLLVMIDPLLIERVLQNLMDNALRYTPKNGVVSLGLMRSEHHIMVSVSDSGSGIDPKHLNHVFDRFWQDQPADSGRPKHSAGLGLAIVKKILDLHKSQITVRSTPTIETVFEFSLARVGPEEDQQAKFLA